MGLDERGFEITPEFLPAATISSVVDSLSNSLTARSRTGMRHALKVPTVRALAEDDCLIELAEDSLGQGAFPFRATLFDKSAQSNWLVGIRIRLCHCESAKTLQAGDHGRS